MPTTHKKNKCEMQYPNYDDNNNIIEEYTNGLLAIYHRDDNGSSSREDHKINKFYLENAYEELCDNENLFENHHVIALIFEEPEIHLNTMNKLWVVHVAAKMKEDMMKKETEGTDSSSTTNKNEHDNNNKKRELMSRICRVAAIIKARLADEFQQHVKYWLSLSNEEPDPKIEPLHRIYCAIQNCGLFRISLDFIFPPDDWPEAKHKMMDVFGSDNYEEMEIRMKIRELLFYVDTLEFYERNGFVSGMKVEAKRIHQILLSFQDVIRIMNHHNNRSVSDFPSSSSAMIIIRPLFEERTNLFKEVLFPSPSPIKMTALEVIENVNHNSIACGTTTTTEEEEDIDFHSTLSECASMWTELQEFYNSCCISESQQ